VQSPVTNTLTAFPEIPTPTETPITPPPPPPPTSTVLPTDCYETGDLETISPGFDQNFEDHLQGLHDLDRVDPSQRKYYGEAPIRPRLFRDSRGKQAARQYAKWLVENDYYLKDDPSVDPNPIHFGYSDPGERLASEGITNTDEWAENVFYVGDEQTANPCRSFGARNEIHERDLLQYDPVNPYDTSRTWFGETGCYFSPREYACVVVFWNTR